MMSLRSSIFTFILFSSLLHFARSDDTSDELLKGINSYRASQNLSSLSDNDNADCLAEQLAKQFKGQPCTNTTGANTVPGTEPSYPNYQNFLDHCHLNATVTRDAAIMPACVPNLDSTLLLSNFTKSQYNQQLNDSSFVGAGIADEGNWVVVVLATNTPTGNLVTVSGAGSFNAGPLNHHLLLLLMFCLLTVIIS